MNKPGPLICPSEKDPCERKRGRGESEREIVKQNSKEIIMEKEKEKKRKEENKKRKKPTTPERNKNQ